jgi:Domain of unknown function (DUF4402)
MNKRLRLSFLCLLWFAAVPTPAAAQCQLCATPSAAATTPARPLKIEISATLDFSTAAHTDSGEGTIEIDPRTGARRVSGGLVALGGMALKGTVRLTGEPFRHVRVTLPTTIVMHSTMGATADITAITADISSDPALGADGTLAFSFGGKMTVRGGAAGDFHGQIQITADYQ